MTKTITNIHSRNIFNCQIVLQDSNSHFQSGKTWYHDEIIIGKYLVQESTVTLLSRESERLAHHI